MADTSKQVRVDNWGIFLLQRLQIFFNKTDYCDLTLQFVGNVQLKVHRLVINACTEYFQVLEQTCEMFDDILIMPSDLQADVVVPIVNFMYTGMIEYHSSKFDKLYKAAILMNLTVLTKLLDAQRSSSTSQRTKKSSSFPVTWNIPEKKFVPKLEPDLPTTYPGRKLPVWKRKNIPTPNKIASHYFTEQKRQTLPIDPLAFADNSPRPTRFEWPEEELPTFNVFDSDYNDLSYSSTPLFTQSDATRLGVSSDAVKDEESETAQEELKRKGDFETVPAKRVCLSTNDKENQSKQTKISITSGGKIFAGEVDHAKIISEVLKKCPNLVKKNKNIRLKILAKTNGSPLSIKNVSPLKSQEETMDTSEVKDETGPWYCPHCSTPTEPVEFVLYYLYQKHMSDVHCEKFDLRMCKFCGHRSSRHSMLLYHQYTKHGVKPPLAYNFPQCNRCPYIAMNESLLTKHKEKHNKLELQCIDCDVTFANQQALKSHIQITGHTGKSGKPTYDCQYCTKKCQSSTVLFIHLRQQHRDEARRDGIVSIDEAIEEDEYILPEQLMDGRKDKIKILSDVKLPTLEAQQQAVALEPSSEAEALNNVATGIATSLGLVDVVVLDDNQYILHTNSQPSISGEQSEFILPDIHDSSTFADNHNQVISGENVTMLHNAQISTTDELVMVLTEQDYSNDHTEIDHSNIVVLYSHPVDCQDNPFISGSNIVLTSQSGLIELRNTNAIVATTAASFITSPSQITMPAQIESIELIQKEINGDFSGSKVKLEEIQKSEIEQKQDATETVEASTSQNTEELNEQKDDGTSMEDGQMSDENCTTTITTDISVTEEIIESHEAEQPNTENTGEAELNLTTESTNAVPDVVEHSVEVQDKSDVTEDQSTDSENIKNKVEKQLDVVEIPQIDHKEELPKDEGVESQKEEDVNNEAVQLKPPEDTSHSENPKTPQVCDNTPTPQIEPKDVPQCEEDSIQLQPENKSDLHTTELVTPTGNVESIGDIPANDTSTGEKDITPQDNTEEPQPETTCVQMENSESPKEPDEIQTLKIEQEIAQSDDESALLEKYKKVKLKPPLNKKAAKIILDDWEDTDSQHDIKTRTNVRKLIDDWDDEEDDGKKLLE